MALVCPVGHPPGAGTSFCRLCGRDYVEAEDTSAAHSLALLGASAEPAPTPVAPALVTPVPVVAPAQAGPPPSSFPPAPLLGSVPLQVHLPLVEMRPEPPASVRAAEMVAALSAAVAPPETEPLDQEPQRGEPQDALAEPEPEPEPEDEAHGALEDEAHAVPGGVDRMTVVAGALAGFLGGLVSGAGITIFLS